MRYDAQLDIFGRAEPIINARKGEQGDLFDTITLPDVTYAGTTDQQTLDNSKPRTGQIFVPLRG